MQRERTVFFKLSSPLRRIHSEEITDRGQQCFFVLYIRPEKRKVQSSKTKSTELTSQNNKTKSTKEGRKISTPPFLHHIEDTIDMIN